jgi:pimeloyl-ACP methyl ester carboxylesterase
LTRFTKQQVKDVAVRIKTEDAELDGNLALLPEARGLVVFAHGSGSSRHSSRNQAVAEHLNQYGLATLLFDLLTAREEQIDMATMHLRFDIELLTRRVIGALDWVAMQPRLRDLNVGLFGASTGAAAALDAAAERPARVGAVVSRGGRPDLARSLSRVTVPTLLIVGGDDLAVIRMNQSARDVLAAPVKEMVIVPGAGHLFEEPGKMEKVADLATAWFTRHLPVHVRP